MLARHPDTSTHGYKWLVALRIRGSLIDDGVRKADGLRYTNQEKLADLPPRMFVREYPEDLADGAKLASEVLEEKGAIRAVLKLVERLSEAERSVLLAVYSRGLTPTEYAKERGVTVSAVCLARDKAIRSLRKRLGCAIPGADGVNDDSSEGND